MKRIISLFVFLALVVSLSACGSGEQHTGQSPAETAGDSASGSLTESGQSSILTESPEPDTNAAEEPLEEPAPSTSMVPDSLLAGNAEPSALEELRPDTQNTDTVQPSAPTSPTQPQTTTPAESESHKILIAYFTWADNTVVEDENAAIQSALDHYESMGDISRYDGVDAVSSASVVPPGNAAMMAGWIQQEVGGDLHSIVVEDPYPDNYDECLDRAADEKARNACPALSTHVNNMEDYDIVFLGFPNWWYTLPMPVLTFVEEYDWSGKTVVPFVTHGTGGLSATVRDLTAALPDDVTVLDAIGVYRPEVPSCQPKIKTWIAGLNLVV